MYRINSIKFKNFKAFYQEETLKLDGNHLLVYGENGSGKSSVFWGLYTFLQSSGKDLDNTKKYFVHYDENIPSTFDSLKNIYAPIEENSFIELETINERGVTTTHRIDDVSSNTNTPLIAIANASSDFINYKLLHNFYTVTHKQNINLWQVFNRDIFPYFRNTEREPYFKDRIDSYTAGVPMSSGGAKVASGSTRTIFERNLQTLNDQIALFLGQIEQNANIFLRENFNDNKDILKINLRYDVQIDYNSIRYDRKTKYSINLILETRQSEADTWKRIPRPHSFFNEAQLTRIAIAVRIGALLTRVNDREYQILCLDDMLISLDMGNRDKVIQLILNTEKKPQLEFFDKFQKLIFTHDKTFYNLCKQRINLSGNSKKWYFKEIYLDTDVVPQRPFIDNSTDYFEKAEKYLKSFDYPAAANSLRQGLENLIFNIIPENERYHLIDGVMTSKMLGGTLASLKGILERYNQDLTTINDLFIYKDHILNPLSHDNIRTQVYKEEIQKVISIIPIVKSIETIVLKKLDLIPIVIKLIDTHNVTGDLTEYHISLKEHLLGFKLLDGKIHLSRTECVVTQVVFPGGVITPLNNKYSSLKQCANRLAHFLATSYADDEVILSKLDLT
jgi:energy-coupling factor transporter ATP-binding protein EcfA2